MVIQSEVIRQWTIPGLVHRNCGRHGNTGHTLEDHWMVSGRQRGTLNTGKIVGSQVLFRVVNRGPDDECQRACGTYGSADEELQVRVIWTQVTVIWWLSFAAVNGTVTLWHYPLLQGRLLTPLRDEGGDPDLWVRDDLDGCGGTPVTAWGLEYRPGLPRTAPRVRIPPSPRGTPAGHPVAASP